MPIKILMLNYEFPPIGGGGGNAHLHILNQYAGDDRLKIDVLTSSPKPGFAHQKLADNIDIYKVGVHKKDLHYWRKTEVLEWLLKAGFCYRKMLRNNNYDLAHAFFGFPTGWLCYRTANKLPYMISLRGSDVPGEHARLKLDYKILAPVFKAVWKKADLLVACSSGLKNRALRFMPSVSIGVIPNGVELDRFYPDQTSQRPEALRLLTVGRLSVTKRVEILIDAVEILHKNGCKVGLTIAGGGSMEQRLKQIVAEKNLGGIIKLRGRVEPEQMPQLYRQSDVFISATMQEGMSNAMLEAMASGLPVITTPCEGTEELINDNGVVVEKADAETIAQAVKKLKNDEQMFEKMRKAARKQAEKFSWKSTAEEYLKCYHKITGNAGQRPGQPVSEEPNR